MTDGDGSAPPAARWPVDQDRRFLLHAHVTRGLGVASIGCDRGDATSGLVCRADPAGDGWVVTGENSTYGTAAGVAQDSFAESVLTTVSGAGSDAFDPAPLALLDHFQVGRTLTRGRGATYALSPELSRVVQVRWFDDILTLDAVLTFSASTEPEGGQQPDASGEPVAAPVVQGWPAPGRTASIAQRISLRPLPAPGYPPRPLHPDEGTGHLELHRFDEVGERDARQVVAPGFRLTGADPRIVFRLDRAVPEPYRSAILDGANWWQDAFARAGRPGVYRVEVCPDGEDLYDPRYGTITWTHRVDRGWSFGAAHVDPRTGEILKGCVRLGSQRIEEVRSLAQAVLGSADERRAEVEQVVVQRLAQLAAHEVGHSLGFAHNFASHTHRRLSVMDYPGPVFDVGDDGSIVVGDARSGGAAYASGLGPWDEHLVWSRYRAGDDGSGHVHDDGCALPYLTDADARRAEHADAQGATWIAAGEVGERLAQVVRVRHAALARFGAATAPSELDPNEVARRFRLLYLLHRFQAVAVLKAVGGIRRRYAFTDACDPDGGFAGAWTPVSEAEQLAAVEAVTDLMSTPFLAISAGNAALLVPPAGGVPERPGGFEGRSAGATDLAAIVRAGVDVVASPLLAPERLNRVAEQSAVVLRAVLAATVRRALATIDLPDQEVADRTSVTIAWAIVSRFRESLTSPTLHAHVRMEILDELSDVRLRRRLPRRQWDAVVDAALAVADPLPRVPPGAPI